jgi:BON domain-containing protein
MRRRHVRTIREEERPTLLLMAAGAVAGAAAGLYLGRRYRSMDAFLADMRGRLAGLRDIWYDEALSHEDRVRLSSDVADVDELDENEDELDDLDEDELEGAPYENAEMFDDDDDDEDGATLDDYDDDDDFEDELEEVTRDNGVEASRPADDTSRRLEERVLRALSNEPVLGERSIEIAVVGEGVVELTGAVHAIEEVGRASAIARSVAGVTMVLNRIVVRSGGNIDTASVPRNPVEAPLTDELLDPNE